MPCAETSRIGWFSEVLTDIGDDQSVIQSLSTFSSHIVQLAHCFESADKGVLVLLDEVAAGTDPDEGAVLAESLLRRCSRPVPVWPRPHTIRASSSLQQRLKRCSATQALGSIWTPCNRRFA